MAKLVRRLSRIDALAITIGAAIGIGVYRNTGLILSGTGSFAAATALWFVIGVLCLGGAVVYSDLSSRVPEAGGQYAYVREAFGPPAAFVYGWMNAGVSIPARQASTAAISGVLLSRWIPLSPRVMAVALLVVLGALHLFGVRAGAIGQRIFTTGKLVTIAVVIGLAVVLGLTHPASDPVKYEPATFAAAVGAVWYAYLGWQDCVMLAEELHEPRRDLPFVMFCTMILTMVLYMAVHVTVYFALGGGAQAYGPLPALDVARNLLGQTGENLLQALMLASVLGVVAVAMMVRPRVAMALSRDGLGLQPLTLVNRAGTPYGAMILHLAIAIALVATGSYVKLLQLISFAMGVLGLFEIASYFVLRRKHPEAPTSRFHPWGPLAFLVMAGALVVSGAIDNPTGVLISFGILVGITIVYLVARPKLVTAAAAQPAPELPEARARVARHPDAKT